MSIESRWEAIRKELRKGSDKLTFQFGKAAIPGVTTIEAYWWNLPYPIGIVWYGWIGLNGIQINNSFVFEAMRRCGIRTALNNYLFSCYPTLDYILSGAGTESGTAWMKASGYKHEKRGWVMRRPRTKPVKPKATKRAKSK